MIKPNCLFCSIANGQMDSATIFENSEFKVILDRYPAAKGHVLIIPKEHVENIFELDGDTGGKLFALATHIAKALKKATKCEGMNIVQNNGEIAGQTVGHFHLHLIPRFKDDGVTIPWETLQLTDEELNQIASDIEKEI